MKDKNKTDIKLASVKDSVSINPFSQKEYFIPDVLDDKKI